MHAQSATAYYQIERTKFVATQTTRHPYTPEIFVLSSFVLFVSFVVRNFCLFEERTTP